MKYTIKAGKTASEYPRFGISKDTGALYFQKERYGVWWSMEDDRSHYDTIEPVPRGTVITFTQE